MPAFAGGVTKNDAARPVLRAPVRADWIDDMLGGSSVGFPTTTRAEAQRWGWPIQDAARRFLAARGRSFLSDNDAAAARYPRPYRREAR